MLLRTSAASLFNLVFPAACRLCGDPLTNVSRLPVCSLCLGEIEPFGSIQCNICGELLFSSHAGQVAGMATEPVCGLCQRVRPAFERAISTGPYDGRLRELIHLLKYERVRSAAPPLGALLASALLPYGPQIGDAILVAVPLHRRKRLQRSFNQSVDIARATGEACRRHGWNIRQCNAAMRRIRPTVSQTGLTRHQRRQNVRGAFSAERPLVEGRNIILIDDVLTTGTTAQECARVLLRAGASKVWVATAARVSKQSVGSPIDSGSQKAMANPGPNLLAREENAATATGNATHA